MLSDHGDAKDEDDDEDDEADDEDGGEDEVKVGEDGGVTRTMTTRMITTTTTTTTTKTRTTRTVMMTMTTASTTSCTELIHRCVVEVDIEVVRWVGEFIIDVVIVVVFCLYPQTEECRGVHPHHKLKNDAAVAAEDVVAVQDGDEAPG